MGFNANEALKLFGACSEPFDRRTTTPSTRLPSKASPSMAVGIRFFLRSSIVSLSHALGQELVLADLLAQRPAQVRQVLPVTNPRRAFAGVEYELHPLVAATVMPNGRDVRCELVGVAGEVRPGSEGAVLI